MQRLTCQAPDPSKHAFAVLAFKEVELNTLASFSDMKSTLVTGEEILTSLKDAI